MMKPPRKVRVEKPLLNVSTDLEFDVENLPLNFAQVGALSIPIY